MKFLHHFMIMDLIDWGKVGRERGKKRAKADRKIRRVVKLKKPQPEIVRTTFDSNCLGWWKFKMTDMIWSDLKEDIFFFHQPGGGCEWGRRFRTSWSKFVCGQRNQKVFLCLICWEEKKSSWVVCVCLCVCCGLIGSKCWSTDSGGLIRGLSCIFEREGDDEWRRKGEKGRQQTKWERPVDWWDADGRCLRVSGHHFELISQEDMLKAEEENKSEKMVTLSKLMCNPFPKGFITRNSTHTHTNTHTR